jgi:hypothetical protein
LNLQRINFFHPEADSESIRDAEFLLALSARHELPFSELALRIEHGIEGMWIVSGCSSFGSGAFTLEDLIDRAWSKVPVTPNPREHEAAGACV